MSDAAHGLRAFTAFFETISELDNTGGYPWVLPCRFFLQFFFVCRLRE